MQMKKRYILIIFARKTNTLFIKLFFLPMLLSEIIAIVKLFWKDNHVKIMVHCFMQTAHIRHIKISAGRMQIYRGKHHYAQIPIHCKRN